MQALALILMLLVPLLVGGVLIGFVQLAAYRMLRRPADTVPPFPILFARGLLVFFLVAAVLAIVLRLPL